MKIPDGSVPLMICTPHPFRGAKRSTCDLDHSHVIYEDAANIELVRKHKGYIICIACAVRLKKDAPQLNIEGQLWNGTLREPQPVEPWTTILAYLNKKS